ncbi:MAG: choline-sulfatase [Pseudomonadota bacterium]
MAQRKPNILLIMVDQLAPQFLAGYGHSVVKTPNLDRLFERGVTFDAAYTNAPLCAPARYVMMSGRLPSKIAAWDNAAEFSAEVPTFAHRLSGLGYRTCLAGKMHFCGPDQLHGFEERLTTDVYPADFTWTPDWDEPERRLDWYHTMAVVRDAGPCLASSYLDFDDEVTFATRRYLFDRARGDDARPFALVVSYIHPHDPYINRPEYWDLYRDDEIDLPTVSRAQAPADPHAARLTRAMAMDDPAPTEAEVRRARRAYYASVSYLDARIGELLKTLEETGQAEDTIILFTADHGDMLGERGLWFKMSYFEHSARVPLVVHWPQAFPSGRAAGAVSLADLLPSLAELGGDGAAGDHPTPLEGHSIVPMLSGGPGHDEVIGEYFGEGTAQPLFMIRRGPLKFVTCAGDPPQLYDVAQDPHELKNLAGEPQYQSVLEDFERDAKARWDRDALRERVLESQRRRRWLAPIQQAQALAWDYAPPADAAGSYIRNTMSIGEIERRSRYPAV